MDVPLLIRNRLKTLGIEQRDLATAARVTESYVSQLLTGKKAPPAPERTDIYEKMERTLRLPPGRLATLADLQRREALKKKLADPPTPLLEPVRDLMLRTCVPETARAIRPLFEKEPFGALERFVTQKLLDVVKRVAKEGLEDERWLRRVTRRTGHSYEQMRVVVLDFLETDLFNLSPEHCDTFLAPMIDSWDIDLTTFAMDIVLSRRLAAGERLRFAFVACDSAVPIEDEPGFLTFLRDATLSGGASVDEIAFLKKLTFEPTGPRPTALYYYRELQNLRDPLHFDAAPVRANPSRRARANILVAP
jgi:transcriptional regulator with XRE-family HTH domain